MPLQIFKPFPRLPQELRSEIWLAAMPEPRLVCLYEHVTETYNEEEYDPTLYTNLYSAPEMVDAIDQAYLDCSGKEYAEDEWDPLKICYARTSIPSLYKIDPGLEHFSQAWKYPNKKPEGKLQTQLESYKFTSALPKPELPLHLLTDCRNIYEVYEATRRGYIWSSCPIPALLHTCRESRSTMKRAGYELTFGHRTSKPRVWFNFRHDTLYLSVPPAWDIDEYPSSKSLDQGPWNIGQLSPDDLVRVERLALRDVNAFRDDCLSQAIRLFGNLKEVLVVRHHRTTKPIKELLDQYYERESREEWGHVETENTLWRCLEYTVADMFSTRWVDRDSRNFRDLQSYLRSGGVETGYWPSVTAKIESFLEQQMEWAVVRGVPSWIIPKVKVVQVVTKTQEEEILQDREKYARRNYGCPPAPPLPSMSLFSLPEFSIDFR
ncbi:hypothetical protein BDZ45DRAFT_216223 [Acephala macrosclerotiorum]|nr:hypothetical protein BDZ45DRAFT_216223 [Acephala macrosclerotiorum]